jgi:hypothetical protein
MLSAENISSMTTPVVSPASKMDLRNIVPNKGGALFSFEIKIPKRASMPAREKNRERKKIVRMNTPAELGSVPKRTPKNETKENTVKIQTSASFIP